MSHSRRSYVLPLVTLGAGLTSFLAARPASAQMPVWRAAAPDAPAPVFALPVPRPTVPSAPPAAPAQDASPATAADEALPIDLPTVLRLVNANSPVIGYAQARVREALARQDRAEVQWLPHLAVGLNYARFDGQTQNQRGEVFGVSRGNLFAGGGPSLRLDLGDAFFDRLVARRLTAAERFNASQATINTQLEAALAYLDLLEVYGRLAINAETLSRAEVMLKFAQSARDAQLSKTAADVNRAAAEVYFRRQERIDLEGRAGAASARLVRQLLLDPTVELRPADPIPVPVVLVDESCTLDDLLATALRSRPDLAAGSELVAAAQERVRKARNGPLPPRVSVEQQTGGFGGGLNDDLARFGARSVLNVGVAWELQNLGFGDAALTRETRAQSDQALYRFSEARARAAAEVVEAANLAGSKYGQLDLARKAVAEATETYRKLRETSFNMVGPRAQYDPLEPLIAIQQLNQAQLQYLAAVLDFNRAQLRLHAALGQPVVAMTAAPKPPAP